VSVRLETPTDVHQDLGKAEKFLNGFGKSRTKRALSWCVFKKNSAASRGERNGNVKLIGDSAAENSSAAREVA